MSFFRKFFPLPEYLLMPAVGIDISDRSVKYVELERKSDGLRLKGYDRKKMKEGVIKNGIIENKEELIKVLKEMKQKIDNDYAIASLPEEKAFLKTVQLPFMEDYQIRKSLEVQLEEIIPFPPEEIIFDFEIARRSTKENKIEIVLSAFPKKVAGDYADVLKESGFKPIAFEVENQSVFRPLVRQGEEGAVMVVDFGKTRTSFLVGEDGFVKFGSTINVSGGHIDSSLSRTLNLDIFEAEKVKKKQSLQESEHGRILSSILPAVSVIKDEVKRVLDYWQTCAKDQGFKNKDIDRIILCGGDSNMIGLVEYMSYELKKPVFVGNPWLNIASFDDYVPSMERKESLMYVTALGLALRSFVITK
ncbi:MAG: type IV pilus assembly protein PilM [Patescibacteria group bacterium]